MKKTILRGCLFLLVLVLGGCSTMGQTAMSTPGLEPPYGWISPSGKLVSDDTNSRNVEFGHLESEMNYYYSDSRDLPPAVIKVHKDYAMDDAQWKPITDPEMLIDVVQFMKVMDKANGSGNFRSFPVKAPDARPIGAWYSNKYVYGMKLRISANKQVSLYVPNFVDSPTYYVKKGSEDLLSKSAPASPELQSSFEIPADAPL